MISAMWKVRDGMAESGHKNGNYCIMRNVMHYWTIYKSKSVCLNQSMIHVSMTSTLVHVSFEY